VRVRILDAAAPSDDLTSRGPSGKILDMTQTATTAPDYTDRDTAIAEIKKSLRKRSGKTWSVKGGRGTSWGWITITAPPARCNPFGSMNDDDIRELSALLDMDVHHQGADVAASAAHRREYVARAQGRTPDAIAAPYWD
jgi:hypothetical protein